MFEKFNIDRSTLEKAGNSELINNFLNEIIDGFFYDFGHREVVKNKNLIIKIQNFVIDNRDELEDFIGYKIYDEFIEHEYKDYGGELKKAKILWEYVDGDIKLKQIPEYIFIVISLLGIILVISIIMICANYYEKHASVNTKVSVGCLGEIIKFLIIYFLIGIFTGGVGFFALPIIWLLENRNR